MRGRTARSTPLNRRARPPSRCPFCGRWVPFVWSCPCGFIICQACMTENLWGMTCNQIQWTCPDCGLLRPFGNQ
jgi:hypothetical protein